MLQGLGPNLSEENKENKIPFTSRTQIDKHRGSQHGHFWGVTNNKILCLMKLKSSEKIIEQT